MARVVMADSISHLPEFRAWYSVIKDTLAEVDLGALLVYMIDTVDASALPALAEQLDVLGYKGFRLAQTEADQREVLKRAIELHAYKATEWAIQEALKSIGFPDVTIKKGIADGYDHWAKFGIKLTNTNLSITADAFTDIVKMVKEYKRAVCELEDVSIDILIEDALNVDDDEAYCLPAITAEDTLQLSGVLKYDGAGVYDGSHDHSGDGDIVTII
jgi:P2-related tail formation protein